MDFTIQTDGLRPLTSTVCVTTAAAFVGCYINYDLDQCVKAFYEIHQRIEKPTKGNLERIVSSLSNSHSQMLYTKAKYSPQGLTKSF